MRCTIFSGAVWLITCMLGLQVCAGALATGNLITHPGFELPATVSTRPDTFGSWGGDPTEITGRQNGIDPSQGDRMLHFLYASGYGATSQYEASELAQLVDLSFFADDVTSGNVVAVAEAQVNRVAGDAQTDTAFGILLLAFSGSPEDYQPGSEFELARSDRAYYLSDADVATWESTSMALRLPSGTDYLCVIVYAAEDVYNDASGSEFDGHYADAVSLVLVPEPATVALVVLGGVALLARRRG